MIDALCENFPDNSTQPFSFEERKAQLLEAITHVRQEMEEVKQRFPYTEKEMLGDKEEVERRRNKLKQEIAAYEQQRKVYEESIRERMN